MAATPLLSSGCAAANAQTAHTELRYMVAGVRVDPPAPGRNAVYVEFQDQTGQGGDFEDTIHHQILEGVQARGYVPAKSHDQANYVLWATLRIFTEAGTAEGERALAGLGAIAGGATAMTAAGAAGAARSTQWVAGIAGAGVAGVAVAALTRESSYQMVIDLQLARKVEGGVKTDSQGGSQSGLQQATATVGDAGGSTMGQSKSQHMTETKVHFEMEQRVLAVASGRRLTQDVARTALIPKLVSGLKSALPRAN
jgi:hypothetical protein